MIKILSSHAVGLTFHVRLLIFSSLEVMKKIKSIIIVISMLFCVCFVKAEEPKAPIYELRTYTTNPGKLPDLLKRFREHTCALFERHGMKNVIYWTPVDEKDGSQNTLIYVLSHKDREAAEKSWKEFQADPEWKKVREASEENGKILAKSPVSVFMNATDFSPMK